jgi:hypothetical protein
MDGEIVVVGRGRWSGTNVQLKEDDGRPTVWRQCECARQGRADAEEQKPGPKQASAAVCGRGPGGSGCGVSRCVSLVCVGVCVCARGRDRWRERGGRNSGPRADSTGELPRGLMGSNPTNRDVTH